MRRIEKYFQIPVWKREVVRAESKTKSVWERTWVETPGGRAQVRGNVRTTDHIVLLANVHRAQSQNYIIYDP